MLGIALNRTAEESQAEVRKGLRQRFTVRRPLYLDRLVKIENRDRASATKPSVRFGIQGDRADLLTKFEAGGTKLPSGRTLAVPVAARTNKAGIVQRNQRPRAILDSGKAFVVRSKVTGTGVIKTRRGRGKNALEVVLYGLTRKARLQPRLRFVSTVTTTVGARFAPNFAGFFAFALRTARR